MNLEKLLFLVLLSFFSSEKISLKKTKQQNKWNYYKLADLSQLHCIHFLEVEVITETCM